jgi:sensor c-di-GMP phosphodiesterase-like protein
MRLVTRNGKRIGHIALVFLGAALGAGLADLISREILLQTGRAELQHYAERVLHGGGLIAEETDRLITAIQQDGLEFCSDHELALMRRLVYNATYVKDIGRVKDGTLFCTTGIGRFTKPGPMHTPDFTINGINYYPLVGLALSRRATGFVIEDHGVTVVLNPESFKRFFEPPRTYSSFLFDPRDSRLLRGFGNPVPLSNPEIMGAKPIEREGVLYHSVCSAAQQMCVVGTESRNDVVGRSNALRLSALAVGALLGIALSLILILLYRRQRSLERQLRRAVRKGALTLVYQPIVDLATDAIVGAEALARWINEAGEAVRPDVFIAIAEEKGFVREITRLVLQRVVEELGDLLRAGEFRVTVNISEQDLRDSEFFVHLEHCMKAAGIGASTIGLELTERSTADAEMATDAISRLQDSGHTVYIDDFGTGYSSLAYLHQLAADAIKIDRTFTQTVCTEAVTASVVPQILDIARRLELTVVVEGIETREQAEYFRGAGVGILAQGWFFGRPVAAAEFRKRVEEGRGVGQIGVI